MPTPLDIDPTAPIVSRHALRINAPLARIWRLHTDVANWPAWQPEIQRASIAGPFTPGTSFRWLTHGMDIISTVYDVRDQRRTVWGGPASGITGVHVWTFAADGDAVLVRTAESWDLDPTRADVPALRAALDESLRCWLRHLGAAAEAG
ncbi:SRPBCC family protein [Goodfellowiella coeruleoviolacea]|uniref:Polyketide cyclase / dehydrase and lipid transport n=1 Tax=Goodfellowiella coeruleoviolacea TaxID=334858 RepID=A0AAE3KK74_9PSEU|nr:SRPBCC family protein [Goodfellowiella coeruleoviolacea]MCP2169084.1 Polyketide cyclase / dehydrase and lipid transport [Goodfellowiella coeruleoviolacea]